MTGIIANAAPVCSGRIFFGAVRISLIGSGDLELAVLNPATSVRCACLLPACRSPLASLACAAPRPLCSQVGHTATFSSIFDVFRSLGLVGGRPNSAKGQVKVSAGRTKARPMSEIDENVAKRPMRRAACRPARPLPLSPSLRPSCAARAVFGYHGRRQAREQEEAAR